MKKFSDFIKEEVEDISKKAFNDSKYAEKLHNDDDSDINDVKDAHIKAAQSHEDAHTKHLNDYTNYKKQQYQGIMNNAKQEHLDTIEGKAEDSRAKADEHAYEAAYHNKVFKRL